MKAIVNTLKRRWTLLAGFIVTLGGAAAIMAKAMGLPLPLLLIALAGSGILLIVGSLWSYWFFFQPWREKW